MLSWTEAFLRRSHSLIEAMTIAGYTIGASLVLCMFVPSIWRERLDKFHQAGRRIWLGREYLDPGFPLILRSGWCRCFCLR